VLRPWSFAAAGCSSLEDEARACLISIDRASGLAQPVSLPPSRIMLLEAGRPCMN
jgi:hypothetical protein